MKKLKILFTLILLPIILSAQQNNETFQYSIKLDSSYLFVDNSNRNWYTLEFDTDTFFSIEGNIFFFKGKSIQIGSNQFDNGKSVGVMGSSKAEEYALLGHKKWELDYQTKSLQKRLKNKEEFYYGKNGKPFLIWWFENPKKSTIPEREIEVYLNKSNNHGFLDSTEVVLNVTHMIFLDFILHGNTSVSLSMPVLENETLSQVTENLKGIANTLNVYGSYIDLKVLNDRIHSKENIFLRDSLKLIEIEIPSWANICKSPYKNVFSLSFPEKDNITNGVAILFEIKTDSITFEDFKKNYLAKEIDANSLKLLSKEDNKERYFFTKKDSWFYGQSIFIKGEKTYCYINFIATKTTYNFNLERLNNLLDRIRIK